MANFPILRSERLKLEALEQKDKKTIFQMFSDPDVVRHYDVEQFKEVREAEDLIAFFKSRFEEGAGIRWAVRDKKYQRLVGTCGFNSWNQYDHSIILGYDLGKKYWGKGYAAEAVSTILDYAFSDDFPFFVNRCEAVIMVGNNASEKLAGRLGFTFEGCLREKGYWDGGFHDMNIHSILRKEWLARDQASTSGES